MGMNLAERLRLLISEVVSRRRLVTALFLLVSLAVTAAGLMWPKSYTSYSTVHVTDNALMSGFIGSEGGDRNSDLGAIAQEILFGRSVLTEVAGRAGWDLQALEPERAEYLLDTLRERTTVSLVGESLIRIEYKDPEPGRAQAVAQAFADNLIGEVVHANAADSEQTLGFIEAQARKYETKLDRLEKAVEQFRDRNRLAGPEAEERAAERLARLSEEYEGMKRALEEARVRKASIEEQLASGTGSENLMSSVEESYQAQLSELRGRLAELRVRYRDSYPDVRATMAQIAQVEGRLRDLREGAADAQELATQAVRASPVYESLRAEARAAGVQVETLRTQLGAMEKQLEQARQEQQRVRRNSSKLAQLTRDYDVTRELHQDLLRRRETARVSASLEEAGTATGLRVEEPAFLPRQAEGPRLLYFLAGAVGLGLLIPLGIVFAIQQLDPRIRRSDQVARFSELPVLAAVPRYRRPIEERAQVRGAASSIFIIILGIAVVAIAGILRLQGEI